MNAFEAPCISFLISCSTQKSPLNPCHPKPNPKPNQRFHISLIYKGIEPIACCSAIFLPILSYPYLSAPASSFPDLWVCLLMLQSTDTERSFSIDGLWRRGYGPEGERRGNMEETTLLSSSSVPHTAAPLSSVKSATNQILEAKVTTLFASWELPNHLLRPSTDGMKRSLSYLDHLIPAGIIQWSIAKLW